MNLKKVLLLVLTICCFMGKAAFCEDATNYYNAANARAQNKDFDGAIEAYDKAIELRPDFAKAYNNRGLAKSSKGDFDGALADYDKAIQYDPTLAQVFFNRGIIKKKKMNLASAIDDLTKAIELKTNYAEAYDTRGTVRRIRGDQQGALFDYNEALHIDPKFANAYNNRGLLKAGNGEQDGALEDYNRAIELKPDLSDFYYNRGLAKQAKGNWGGAREDFDKAVGLNPALGAIISKNDHAKAAGPEREAIIGGQLSFEEVSMLESALTDNPTDLSTRTKLLGYYFLKQYSSRRLMASREKQILWVIKHRPEAAIAGTPYCSLDPFADGVSYNEAKEIWLNKVQTKTNAQILGNAAQFILLQDRTMAENLLKQASNIDPTNLKWLDLLAQLYMLKNYKDSALDALAISEKAQASDTNEITKFDRLDILARSAFLAGNFEKASKYASQLLETSRRFPESPMFGNAIHQANIVLGRIALRQGNTQQAVGYLLQAGRTPGSPSLDSFGPNMALAKDLLEKGETDSVVQYFNLCRGFWVKKANVLDEWINEVNAGNIPNFGANLYY